MAPRQWWHLKQSAGLAGWDKFILQLFFVTFNITIFIFVVSRNLVDVEHLFCSTVGVWGGWSWRHRELHRSGRHRSFSSPVPSWRFVSLSKIWLYLEKNYVTFQNHLSWSGTASFKVLLKLYNINATPKFPFWKTQFDRANLHICFHIMKQGELLDWQMSGDIVVISPAKK